MTICQEGRQNWRVASKILISRVSYNGIIPASQADDVGSIPITRSNFPSSAFLSPSL